MTEKYPTLYWILRITGLILVGVSIVLNGISADLELYLAVGLILVLGIPHGATDFKIFKELKNPVAKKGMLFFYGSYLGLMGIYALIWWLAPILALIIFILISLYHFGQSNWVYLEKKNIPLYLVWGAFVLLTPILLNKEQSGEVIFSMTGKQIFALTEFEAQIVVLALGLINVVWIFFLKLSPIQLKNELLNLFLLGLIYYFLPLWIGFVFYFVGFHSLTSIGDQIEFFRKNQANFNWKNYIKSTAPLTLVSIAGLGGLVYLSGLVHLAMLFIFISVVTMPHMIIMDLLYNE